MSTNYVVSLDKLSQLVSYSFQRRDDGVMTDVIDGSLFKQMRAEDSRGDLWISFLLHYDSIVIAKSSRPSLDPIQLQVIELPPKLRCCYSSMVLAGLYVGPKKKFDINVLTSFLADQVRAWNLNPPAVTYQVIGCIRHCLQK